MAQYLRALYPFLMNEAGDGDGGGASDTPPPVPEPPATPPAPQPQNRVLPPSNRERSEQNASERERGRKAAMAELERKAKKAGFKSLEDMFAKTGKRGGQRQRESELPTAGAQSRSSQPAARAGDAPPAPVAPSEERASRRLQKDLERTVEERRKANRARATEEKKRLALQRELDDTKVRNALMLAAVKNGVKDPDYAVELCRRHYEALPNEAQQATFDENAFFATELRKTHPYLYGVEERPANTSPGSEPGERGAAPKPAGKDQTPPPNPNGKKDARQMSHTEYQKELETRGLMMPSSGIVSGLGGSP